MVRAFFSFTVASGLILAGAALAGERPTPSQRIQALKQEIADAETRFRDAWAKLPDPHQDDPEVEKLYKAFEEKQRAGFVTALEIAQADPSSEAGFAALEWLLLNPRTYHLPSGKAALELLAQHHAGNRQLGKALAVLAYYPIDESSPAYRPAVDLLQAVTNKNPDRMVRGQAALGLAWLANRDFQWAESRSSPDTDRLARTAETAFEAVLRDYGDCPNLRSRGARPATATLADEVKSELYALRQLRIGRPAPDIDGEDLAGKRFKLSECRGKVVLLVFWASWCGPCMGAVPHERELVERFRGRPFVLVGVNGDEKRESAQQAVDKHRIPWRSFWNGPKGAGGPIATTWNVRGWPTVYVLDHEGVIRHKYLQGKRLDEPLETLISAVEVMAKVTGR
jgi:thiol-disulfide isomerase/thioredoxin